MIDFYGIPNCDTVKKARTWLEAEGIPYKFRDYRANGLDRSDVERWVKALGWEKVLNKASTTWRELPDAEKAGVDQARAIGLMLQHPTLVKRPVLETGGAVSVGFKPADWGERFGK